MKQTLIKDPVFQFRWWIQRGGKEYDLIKKFCRSLREPVPEDNERGNFGSFIHNTNWKYCGALWLNKDAGSSTLAHEVHHLTMYVCKVLEVDPRESEEFSAHYTGYITKEIVKRLF